MASALNTFKTFTANLVTSSSTIYTAPTGYTSVVLLAQVSNITSQTIVVKSSHVRGAVPTTIVEGLPIPPKDAVNVLLGKLILQTGDSISASVDTNSAAQMIVSILETLNP